MAVKKSAVDDHTPDSSPKKSASGEPPTDFPRHRRPYVSYSGKYSPRNNRRAADGSLLPADPESLEKSENAIKAAVDAARDLDVERRHAGLLNDEDEEKLYHSFTLELDGLEDAVHAGDIEKMLSDVDGVTARIVYGDPSTAWVSAPSSMSVDHIISILQASGVSAVKKLGSVYRQVIESEAEQERKERKRRRHRRHNESFLSRHPFRVKKPDNMEALFTARALITKLRLIVAVALSVPVVAIALFPRLQFPYWQWVSAGLALPVVSYCAWPFHRAAVGGLRRKMAALDSATSLAVAVAYVWSVATVVFMRPQGDWTSPPKWLVFQHQPQVFFDVACGATTLVLLGRLLSRRNRLHSMELLSTHNVDSGMMVTVIRRTADGPRKQSVSAAELHPGEDILVAPGDIIPVDGVVVGGSSLISPGPVSGHSNRTVVKVNSHIYAGGRNMGDTLKIRVDRSGHTTRLAAMHRWVEECDYAEHMATRTATRSASLLVPWAIVLAVMCFLNWFLIMKDAAGALAASLAVLTGVGPVSLAISTTLASRLGLARAISRGILFRDEQVMWDLGECDMLLFNRVGTLTTGNMKVESVTAAEGENADLILRVAGALAMESEHGVSRALVKAARESRDLGAGGSSVPHWIEVTGEQITDNGSFIGTVDIPIRGEMSSVKAALWRPRDLSELKDDRLAMAAISGGTPLVVSWKNKNRGVITVIDATKDDAAEAIEQLEDMGIETGMLSRDTYPVAKKSADSLGMSLVLAGIAPSRKGAAVRSMHREGYSVALVGDRDLMKYLAVADVGILVGAADCLDTVDASVVILRDEVRAVPDAVNLATKVRRVGKGNMNFSRAYNTFALVGGALSIINPLVSTLLMLLGSTVIEMRTLTLRRA